MAIVHRLKPFEISDRLGETAFAFRGYNQTNLGRTPELLAHRVYGPVVERRLREASQICSDLSGRRIDLVSRVREKRESTLDTFGEDIGLIISVELAQIELLEQHFDISYRQGRVALGYSLGEVTALVTSGVFNMAEVLAPLVAMADDGAELARDVTMGVVFSRGKAIDLDAIERSLPGDHHSGARHARHFFVPGAECAAGARPGRYSRPAQAGALRTT